MIRLRKQNDDVKLIALFFLIGASFFVSAIYHSLQFYYIVNTPVEYVLTYISGNVLSEMRLEELAQSENVSCVSRQAEKTVNIKYHMQEASISYVELSASYMEAVYGIKESGSMKTFYINEPAYEQLVQSMQNAQGGADMNGKEFTISYELPHEPTDNSSQQAGGYGASVMDYGTARVVVLRDGVQEEEPYIFCRGTNIDLGENTLRVRVRYEQQDLDGMNRKSLERLGFIVDNENLLLETEYKLELELIKVRYDILLAVICIGCAGLLVKKTNVVVT